MAGVVGENHRGLSDKHLWGVHFVDPEHGWIVGEEGEVLHTQDGGKRWVRQRSNAEQPLFAVHFANLTHGGIVGTNGLILHTTDGGKTLAPTEDSYESKFARYCVPRREPRVGSW